MNRAGRTVQVRFVMTSMVIYLAMEVDLPPWALKAMDKIRRGFLWQGRKDAKGGHCLLAWPKVTRPLELGGLGIHDLKSLCWALRMRWLWLEKTQLDKPWAAFPIQVQEPVKALFVAAMNTIVGDGNTTLFWTDNWLHSSSLAVLAPHIFALVPKRRRNRRKLVKRCMSFNGLMTSGVLSVSLLLLSS